MESGDAHPPETAPSRTARARARVEQLQAAGRRVAERAQVERGRHRTIDTLFEVVDRDGEVGGGIMGGALAYRLFIWLLPFALVGVGLLGIASDAAAESPEQAAGSVGLTGLVSHSVARAAESRGRWYAVLIGIPLLLWATRSLLRTLIVVHRLVWGDLRRVAPRPTPAATLRLLALLVGYFLVAWLATRARGSSVTAGVIASLVVAVPFGALWLLVSLRLPHRGVSWQALLPGAALFAFGIQALDAVGTWLLAPEASNKQGTYGVLGLAAALLLGLYLLGRLVVATAVLNATLAERPDHVDR